MEWFILLDVDWVELFSDSCSFLLLIGFLLTCVFFIFAKKIEPRRETKIKTEEDAWKQLNGKYTLIGDWILSPVLGYTPNELDIEALDYLLLHKHIHYSVESLDNTSCGE